MPDFPPLPLPSSISAPEVIDPMLSMRSDFGYEVRRTLHPRPRFRYTVEWLGKTTHEMRYIRDFLLFQRLGTLAFSWYHGTGWESNVTVHHTTPIFLTYPIAHGLTTGMWVYLSNPVGVGVRAPALLPCDPPQPDAVAARWLDRPGRGDRAGDSVLPASSGTL